MLTAHTSKRRMVRQLVLIALCGAAPAQALAQHDVQRLDVRDPNAFDNRVITFGDLTAAGETITASDSINGPSMIYIPDGTPNKLADYYLYFADHGGDHIRMAYGDSPVGPFTLYQPNTGVLSLNGNNTFAAGGNRVLTIGPELGVGDHIASPDITFDADTGLFNMSYHGNRFTKQADGSWKKSNNQRTFVAYSSDGLSFNDTQYGVGSEINGSYLREFEYKGLKYGLAMNGVQVRPTDQANPYTNGDWQDAPFNKELRDSLRALAADPDTWADDPNNDAKGNVVFRHNAVKVDEANDKLSWWYTAKAEAPERIYEATVALGDDWTQWTVTDVREVLRPEFDYEGANLDLIPSTGGRPKVPGSTATGQVNELRDPAYFFDPISGREFLYYSVAGEYGIAVAELFSASDPGVDPPVTDPVSIVNYAVDGVLAATSTADGVSASSLAGNGNTRFDSGGFRNDDADPQVFSFTLEVEDGQTLALTGFTLRLMADQPNHLGQVRVNGEVFGDVFTNGGDDDVYLEITGENVDQISGLTGSVLIEITFDVPGPGRDTVIDDVELFGLVTAVTPIPEPASAAVLLGLWTAATFVRRRPRTA